MKRQRILLADDHVVVLELRYETDIEYKVWGDVRPWQRDPSVNVGEMLRQAMKENPYLKVLIQGGYYDAAIISALCTRSRISSPVGSSGAASASPSTRAGT